MNIPQFGTEPEKYQERICAYAVVFNNEKKILAVKVNSIYHLPGGGVDNNESPEEAVVREIKEETGLEISNINLLGKANQFFSNSKMGPLNKLGIFYKANLANNKPKDKKEVNHYTSWITPEDFLQSNASEFQKWMVEKTIN